MHEGGFGASPSGGTTSCGKCPDLGSITSAQAEHLARQAAALGITQVGPGNSYQAGAGPGVPALVIQNTLNDQHIQSRTEINAASNGMSLLKGMNLMETLNSAVGAATR
jgi:hypothetical protein